jgi:biopolymer transport protein ExbB/TolQ
MLTKSKKREEQAFEIPLMPSIVVGSALCCLFYFLILLPPFRHPLVIRYALCHWVAVAAAWLFTTAAVYLVQKRWALGRQRRLVDSLESVLDEWVDHRADWDIEPAMDGYRRATSLQALWKLQKTYLVRSWYGQRLGQLLMRQVERRTTARLDEDLEGFAERDAEALHSSYAMVRINCWAMPMLGFLGTVIGISDTLGQMDAQALASGSQEAMNGLTSGLYVAFDTTAVGLVLTMVAMFMQFFVQRAEQDYLGRMDQGAASAMHRCLSDQEHSDTRDVEASLKLVANRLIDSMQILVQQQAQLWRDSIGQAQSEWSHMSSRATETSLGTIQRALAGTLAEHRDSLRDCLTQLSVLQTEGAQQIDGRLQQWQTTLSEQSRLALRQQQEVSRNAELLQKLLDSTQLVQAMQQPIQATLERMTDFDRFQEAALSLTEAVMVLSTQLERSGHISRQAVRRRQASRFDSSSDGISADWISPDAISADAISDDAISADAISADGISADGGTNLLGWQTAQGVLDNADAVVLKLDSRSIRKAG